FGLSGMDLETVFEAGKEIGIGAATLKDILHHLQRSYCESIGVEYMYIRHPEKIQWIRDRIHENDNHPSFTPDQKKHILDKLNQAVSFENFLHTRFPGQKRFSLEGGETLIPALDAAIEHGADLGMKEFVVGMAHRGRLNTLVNIFHKPYRQVFSEFVSKDYLEEGFDGDVKYHLGHDENLKTDKGHEIQLTLCPNPSHLETVNAVVEGISRAKINKAHDGDHDKVCPILIHGDAAVAGQGIVYEVIQMAQLDGYKTGGTVHIVINNQVGFTTNYLDARSSTYCTDVAKVTLSPVFHVNGDDVEALVHTMRIAMEYRQRFNSDVFIDLLCYRKYGHNEGDEPKFTQPLLYKAIAAHPNPRDIYRDKLIEDGTIDAAWAKNLDDKFREMLTGEFEESKKIENAHIEPFLKYLWKDFKKATPKDFVKSPETGVDKKTLTKIGEKLGEIPEGKKFFRKLEGIIQNRIAMLKDDKLDWSMGELLAYGSLLVEGHSVRLSGQDVERGTFSHRHAVVKVEDSEEEYVHLNNLDKKQATFAAYNSLLSEYGVMGFDYGYSLGAPDSLVLWEAQFGDFFNGAQIMLDQYICCAEDKWKTQSGIVLLLPHGYEGAGAEHSSARIERFLNSCAENNWQIVNCTTPANYFHALRRQLKREFRKPLVVFTPKSLLRHPKCVSSVADLAKGRFQEVIDDATADAAKVKKVVFCQGKVYYDLLERNEEQKRDDIAFVRIEQLYPTPVEQIDAIVKKYGKAKELVWAQEEPENMGAWYFLHWKLKHLNLSLVSRNASSATAPGSSKRDAIRQNAMLEGVFA
ncbi:MAG: 2-oxoglutarate dehydrogenase E1 component, partial [Bacteroidota bacterium]